MNAGTLEGGVQAARLVGYTCTHVDAKVLEPGSRAGIQLDMRVDRWRGTLAAVLLWLAACGAQAQSAVVDSYQESEGLTNMTVRCLTQESRGTLWICTENGMFRFDGFRIHRESLPSAAGTIISNALADRLGRLWVATRNGLYVRRVLNGLPWWSNVTASDEQLYIDPGHRLDVDDHGTLFAMDWRKRLWTVPASQSEVLRAQPAAVAAFAPPAEPSNDAGSGPLLTLGDSLWLGCGAGLCLWRDGRLTAWGPAQGLPPDTWSTLVAARDGGLWARSSSRLARLAPHGGRFVAVNAPSARQWAGTVALAEDPAGAIVTATDDGVARWDGQRWQSWTRREGLPEAAVRTLMFDAEGSLWLGTSGQGLHRWVGYGVSDHWTQANGLPSPAVTSFARAGDGRLWIATSKGIAWFDESGRKFRALHWPSATGGPVRSLGVDACGSLWWAEDGKLLTLRLADSQPRAVANVARLSYVVQGPRGTLYFESPQGVLRLMPSAPHLRHEAMLDVWPGAPYLQQVMTDGKHDWLLSGSYLRRVEGNAWTPMHDERGVPLDINLGVAAFSDPSELWTGDEQGISAYSVHDAVAHLVRRFDRSSFGGAMVDSLRSDAARRVWLGTDRGVFVLDNGRWSHIDRANGLLWNDVTPDAIFIDADGTAWIGTKEGATRIYPGLKRTAGSTLRLDELQFGARTIYTAPHEAIAWADRRMRITVGTPSIGSGRDTRLEYRLRGSEPWQAVDGNVIEIGSPEPDSYLLEVRTVAGLPNDYPGPALQIPFSVKPPWWASTSARLGYAACLAAFWYCSVLVLRRRAAATQRRLECAVIDRTRALADRTTELESSREALHELGEYNARSLEAERKRVSRELHDEMGQQLAALRMEVSVARMRVDASQSLGDGTLDTLLERVDGLVASVRTMVTQLRPPALDGGLVPAVEWLAAEFSRGTGLPCDLSLDAGARELPPDAATMVFRIAQESLTNVRRHAAARKVSVALRPMARQWELVVHDDGVGFDVTRVRTGHGLLGMSERARVLGGALTIESVRGEGTTIRLLVGQVGIES